MKSKRLFQFFVLLAVLFGMVGSGQPARAEAADPIINDRELSFWDATYFGFVNASLYEKWHFSFTETHTFTVTVTTLAGDLVPLLLLLDGSDGELAHGVGTLTSTQSAGDYSIQVQPSSGAGFYMLTIREIIQPYVSTSVNPGSINAGESALATVSLNNIPEGGYTSAEFTCPYNPTLVQVSNIAVTGLFGPDPAIAIHDPQNGSFIVAVAGSNGNRATVSGAAFTFNVKGLQAGQTPLECAARVSRGDNLLTSLPSIGTTLTIGPGEITPTFTPTPTGSVEPTSTFTETPTPTGSIEPTSTFTETPTPTGSIEPTSTFTETPTPTGSIEPTSTFTETPTPTGSIEPTSTFTETPTPTNTPTDATPSSTSTATASPTPTEQPPGTLAGRVIACREVTVNLYNSLNDLIASWTTSDGNFSVPVSPGTYTVEATAEGFLRAAGSATITSGETTTMPTITLLAGDITDNQGSNHGDDVIDQWDAMTIGINYNKTEPIAADLNCDGIINVLDLELLAANYRKTGPTVWE